MRSRLSSGEAADVLFSVGACLGLLSVFLFLSCPSMFENQDCSSHFASGFEFLSVMLHWFSLHLSSVASPEA
ncbi:hypothetical protein DY000_02048740 [Brassica cretica]|uniref:Dolichyl-diphosphooligosaccharide--protein glycosyltransferase subunit KCP2 n=1 Tax=Brassica cretica TaxID=69181 RepID=A0ABQ7ENV9_BRACR|nr:hypothetical protein DY000_02048740 [Brassica cretica]